MFKFIKNSFIVVMLLLSVALLSSCGQTQATGSGSDDTGAVTQEQADIEQADDNDKESDSRDSINSGSKADNGDMAEFVEMLSNPKLPSNYTYEAYQEIDPYVKVNETYQRYTVKDKLIRVDNLAYEGEDKDKVTSVIYYDASTNKQIAYDLKKKVGMEYVGSSPESWNEQDLNFLSKQYAEGYGKNSEAEVIPLKKVGEETIEGYPCVVFEVSYYQDRSYVQKFFVGKEYNVILQIYQEEDGMKKTLSYRNLKVGEVTDDMVKPNIPDDIVMTKQ